MIQDLNSKRIAKNTLLLYFRMLIIMVVSLYTSRLVLKTLGVVDFGIYNVVGGIVMLFSFVNSAMAASTQRFLSFEMGKGDTEGLARVFSTGINIHVMFALVILFFAETAGLWFLNTQMVIPAARMATANWVYQFSILSIMTTVMTVPFNASIIARERMNAFAYISILEALLKLAVVFLLVYTGIDKLRLYAMLMFTVTLTVQAVYVWYCRSHFSESHYRFDPDKNLFREMLGFAGWNFFGAASGMAMNQGVNILLNLFFGPVVNAARAVAFQVQGAVNGFVFNFMTAVNPQIVKSYSSGERKYMLQLIFSASKFSFFLLYLITLPVLMETGLILKWWLGNVPADAEIFTRLSIIFMLTIALTYSINMASQATGNIKVFQIVEGSVLLLNLPVSYVLLRLGFPATSAFWVMIILSIAALFARLAVLRSILDFPVKDFILKVIVRVVVAALFSLAPVYLLFTRLQSIHEVLRFLIILGASCVAVVVSFWIFGLNAGERSMVKDKATEIVRKFKKQ